MNYLVTTGRRKTSIARVFLSAGTGKFVVNDKPLDKYFFMEINAKQAVQPFVITDSLTKFDAKITVKGGGTTGQAIAVQLGIARALVDNDETVKPVLRKAGFLTRDSRMVERKKYGQKKARKRFQFSKR